MKLHLSGGLIIERNEPAKRGRKPKAEKVEEPKVVDSEPQSED